VSRLRPIGHEDRLSLVEHLDELRNRLIACVVVFMVAFSVAYWQNGWLLDTVNKPLYSTQNLKGTQRSQDPLEESARLQLKQGQAAKATSAALQSIAVVVKRIRDSPGVSKADQDVLTESARLASIAARLQRDAAAATPTNQKRLPVTLGVTEPFVTTFTVAAYAALLLALPFILFQAYAFVLPAFSSRERQVALPLMLLVPVLFISGVVFAYYAVLPNAIDFLQNFNDDNYDILLQARDYYRFSILLLLVMGVCFQVPIGLIAVTRVGIVSTSQLRKNRRYAILVIAIAAMLLPGQDPVTMLSIMIPLIVLYEGSILLCALLDKREKRALAREQDAEPAEDDEESSDQLVRVSDDD
jgi:sec-independent protein translocase protein TatC